MDEYSFCLLIYTLISNCTLLFPLITIIQLAKHNDKKYFKRLLFVSFGLSALAIVVAITQMVVYNNGSIDLIVWGSFWWTLIVPFLLVLAHLGFIIIGLIIYAIKRKKKKITQNSSLFSRSMIIVFGLIVLVSLCIACVMPGLMTYGERSNAKNIATQYLERKYGDQGFVATGVYVNTKNKTDFSDSDVFDGYYVVFKSNKLRNTFSILVHDNAVDSDSFLSDYYAEQAGYTDRYSFAKYDFVEEWALQIVYRYSDISDTIAVKSRIEGLLLSGKEILPSDYGRIPTKEEYELMIVDYCRQEFSTEK